MTTPPRWLAADRCRLRCVVIKRPCNHGCQRPGQAGTDRNAGVPEKPDRHEAEYQCVVTLPKPVVLMQDQKQHNQSGYDPLAVVASWQS